MFCYNCGCLLTEYDYCPTCGADVKMYKKIVFTSNRFYNEGLEKAQVRDLSGAIVSLRESLKFDKNNIDARNLLGLVYFEIGEVGAALTEWVISQNSRPEKNLANEYISMLQSSDSRLSDMRLAIHKYNTAYSLCLQNNTDVAEIQLRGALSKNRQYVRAHLLLALLYMAGEKWERAENELQAALRVDHGNIQAQLYLQEVEHMLEPEEGEKKPAKKNNKDVIRYERDDELIIQPASVKEPRNTGIGTLINILIGLVLGAAAVYFLVVPARVSKAGAEAQESIKDISSQLDVKTSTIQELENKIASLEKEKEALDSVIEDYSGDNGMLTEYDRLIVIVREYLVNKNNDETAKSLDEIRDTVDITTMPEEYQKTYRALLTLIGPALANTYYEDGMEAYRAEDYETAVDKLTRAFYYDESNADALFTLGNAYRLLGNYEDAISIYEQVVRTFPDTERATKSQQYINELTN